MGKEIYKRNILYAFAKAIMENDRKIVYEEYRKIEECCISAYMELKIKEKGIKIRTGEPYKPSTIKACRSRLEHYERLTEDCKLVLRLFDESQKGKVRKQVKQKGKVIQLTAYQGKEA